MTPNKSIDTDVQSAGFARLLSRSSPTLGTQIAEYDMNGTESSARFEELFSEMFSESDRGCILIGASALDDVLSSLLQKHLGRNNHVIKNAMEPLFAGMGPLSSFSARIKSAYCLGLIKQRKIGDRLLFMRIHNA